MDVFWSLYLAQIGEGAAAVGLLALIFGGVGAICALIMESLGDLPRGTTRKLIKVCIAGVLVMVIGMAVPSQKTIIWSAGIEHGPEYVERLISSMGANQ